MQWITHPRMPLAPAQRLVRLSRPAAAVGILVGCLVLLGWAFRITVLMQILPMLAPMKVNTALCFLCSGLALYLWHTAEARALPAGDGLRHLSVLHRGAIALALLVLTVGLISFIEEFLDWNAGIDELLMADISNSNRRGRMSPGTAAAFAMLGTALLSLSVRSEAGARIAQALAAAVVAFATLAILGYVYGAQAIYQVRPFVSVAVHTAVTFLILGVGVLCARPAEGWFRQIAADTASARMGRRLLVSIGMLLPALAGLGLQGLKQGWYGPEFGFGMLVTVSLFMLGLLIWGSTRSANQAELRIRYLNRVYAMLSEINALIVRVRDRDELFDQVCAIAVRTGGFSSAWLGLVEGARIRVVATASESTTGRWVQPSEALLSLSDTARVHSPVAQAVRSRLPVIANDVTEAVEAPLRAEYLARGVRSFAVLPLVADGETQGVFKLHADVGHFFSAEEMRLLREMAGDIVFALDHLKKDQALNYLAYFDSLTGLANETLLRDRLRQQLSAARRSGEHLALMIVDVRHFKAINDAYGRNVGDEILKQIARRLQAALPDVDDLARTGANQFAVIIPRVASESDAAQRNERLIQQCFEAPFAVEDESVRLSVRAGAALYPEHGCDENQLFSNAEEALKLSRARGERLLFFRRQSGAAAGGQLQLESKLRQAVEQEQFVLHYQPKLDAATRSIRGVEALIRWQSPEQGLVPPGLFIPLLEDLGLIREVGAWALRRAAQDSAAFRSSSNERLRIAVNVSAVQLCQPDFVDTVARILDEAGCWNGIDLEITESLAMANIEENIGKLRSLRRLGIHVAIDDFGTGYSSLAYLARLPADYLKIDRSFVMGLPHDPDSVTLVTSMITLAHSLHLKLIAEGVETEAQAALLQQLGCDQLQGFLFSKPVPLEDVVSLVESRGCPID